MTKLQTELEHAEAEVVKGDDDITKERAVVAARVAKGKDVSLSCDLLVILEGTQLINTKNRDRLEKEEDAVRAAKPFA